MVPDPHVLYSDHGAVFTSAHLERVCLDTHIRLITFPPRSVTGPRQDRTGLVRHEARCYIPDAAGTNPK